MARSQQCIGPMLTAMGRFNITSVLRIRGWLAQVAWESGNLTYFAEIASGWAYEGRADLGNTHPGDGPRYKGSGPLQVTGRYNFEAAAAATGLDLVNHPELARTVQYGFQISAWWWAHNQWSPPWTNCNLVADSANNRALSRAINRGNPYSGTPAQAEAERMGNYYHIAAMGNAIAWPGGGPNPVDPHDVLAWCGGKVTLEKILEGFFG